MRPEPCAALVAAGHRHTLVGLASRYPSRRGHKSRNHSGNTDMNVPVIDRPSPASRDRASARQASSFLYSPSIIPGIVQFFDALIFLMTAVLTTFIFNEPVFYYMNEFLYSIIFVIIGFYTVASRHKLYTITGIMRPMYRADDILIAIISVFLLLLSSIITLSESETAPIVWIAAFSAASVISIISGRLVIKEVFASLSRRKIFGRNLVVLGNGEQIRRFLNKITEANPYFLIVDGVFHYEDKYSSDTIEGYPVLGSLEDLFSEVRARRIDDIVVAMPWNADHAVLDTVERLKELPVNVFLSSDLVGFDLAFRPAMGNVAELPMFEVVQRPISGWSAALKTVEDYVLASFIIILISPLLFIIAIAIKIDSPGPIIFRQKRLGFNNKEFSIYKFRSMYHRNVPEDRVKQATKGDPRITRVGRIIRATSLDELPQLFNVLDGTMSLVGPRPHAISHNEEFGQRIRGYFARHRVKPGITGWAQVNGLRGETDTIDKMEARIRHDVYYAENWSLLFDIKILIMTALVVFFQKTAY